MDIIQWIIVIIILISPVLILLIPFVIAWKKGKKKLSQAHKRYEKALKVSLGKLLDVKYFRYDISTDVEATVEAKNKIMISGKVWLVDRRYYFYYIASLIRPLNDAITLEITLSFIPSLAMLIVSKNQDRLIRQALSYAEELKVADIEELSDKYLILVDDLYAFRKVLDDYMIRELANLHANILYILLDYGSPNITVFIEINEKNYHKVLPRVINIIRGIINKLEKLPPKRTKVEVLKRIRKTFLRIQEKYKNQE